MHRVSYGRVVEGRKTARTGPEYFPTAMGKNPETATAKNSNEEKISFMICIPHFFYMRPVKTGS